MFIVFNLIILGFLVGMAALWASYGFFSSFLNLMIVIAAGVIALSVWEPLAYWLLGRMPFYAHGVGLLAPFALLLIVLRVVFDKFCTMNLKMHRVVDQIGGGACGYAAGVLAMGLFLNGANFLPIERGAMGWQPYAQKGDDFDYNDEGGRIWSFQRVDEWSSDFYNTLSAGSMRPMSGPSLSEARPNLAKRAALYRMPLDSNQLKSAHPESVKVEGMYSLPATPETIKAMVQRSMILSYISLAHLKPQQIDFGKDGMGLVNAMLTELRARFADPVANGRPSQMLDIEAVQRTARTDMLRFDNPIAAENFEEFLKLSVEKIGDELAERMAPVLSPDKNLLLIDTHWNNTRPGIYNKDGKLRVDHSQVRLQVRQGDELKLLSPVGFSIEHSQNNGSRTFTPTIEVRPVAYASYTDFHIGWVFAVPNDAEVVRMFVRELRFDLSELFKAGAEAVNQNPGAMAYAFGVPSLPKPREGAGEGEQGPAKNGVAIADTGSYAEVNEALPSPFSGSSTSVKVDESTNPWTLEHGATDNASPGRGGQKSTVRDIWVLPGNRLVRIKIDLQQAQSLYGRARALAQALNVIRIKDEGGNDIDAIGYVLQRADQSMQFDIRESAYQGGISASELPGLQEGQDMYLYFQVPVGTNVISYTLGSEEYVFEKPLKIEEKSGR